MTEESKKNILNYITDDINSTSPTTDEIFQEVIEKNNDEWKSFLPDDYYWLRFEGLVATNDGISDITVIYGGYTTEAPTATNGKGIIILLDNNFKPIKSFLKFDSGTDLRYVQCMNADETGQFYMVDDKYFSCIENVKLQTSEKRFVLLNNIAIKSSVTNDYSLNLRKSYILSGNYQNFYCRYITKNPDSAHYVFVGGEYVANKGGYHKVKAISLVINVGSTNEWWFSRSNINYRYGGCIVLFDSEDQFYMRCMATKTESSQTPYITEIYKNYTSESFGYYDIATYNYIFAIDGITFQNQCVFINKDICYFVLEPTGNMGSDNRLFISLNKFDFTNKSMKRLFEKQFGTTETFDGRVDSITLGANLGKVYVSYVTDYDNNNDESSYYMQRLENDVWNPKLIGRTTDGRQGLSSFYVKNNFNLLQAFTYQISGPNSVTDNFYNILVKENYNPLNYNGEPYTDYNSLIPKQGEVFSNNSLVFARNIYNKTLNENQTVSTVAIPNNYLNDIDLDNNKLLAETKTIMIDDEETITKNIYETLFLNYVNTINVIDEDTGNLYPNAAIYVNTNINDGSQASSENSTIGLIQINTAIPVIQNIVWEKLDDTHKQTSFALKINEIIPSIDFKSADGTTTYLTIDTSNLEVGKTYTISQKLRIE